MRIFLFIYLFFLAKFFVFLQRNFVWKSDQENIQWIKMIDTFFFGLIFIILKYYYDVWRDMAEKRKYVWKYIQNILSYFQTCITSKSRVLISCFNLFFIVFVLNVSTYYLLSYTRKKKHWPRERFQLVRFKNIDNVKRVAFYNFSNFIEFASQFTHHSPSCVLIYCLFVCMCMFFIVWAIIHSTLFVQEKVSESRPHILCRYLFNQSA